MKKIVCSITMLTIIAFLSAMVSQESLFARTKIQSTEKTLRFWALNEGAIVTCSIVDVFLSDWEEYSISGTKVVYKRRESYAHATDRLNCIGSVDYYVVPAHYEDSKGNVVNSFSYFNVSSIYPGNPDLCYCKRSEKNVTYPKSNNYYSSSHLFVGVEGALAGTQVISTNMSLACFTK